MKGLYWNYSQNLAQAANAKIANITASKASRAHPDELVQDLHFCVINTDKIQSITNSIFSVIRYFTLSKCGRLKQMGNIITLNPRFWVMLLNMHAKHIKRTAKQRGPHGHTPPHVYII